ncbi:hypothetical protein N7488_009104 [Penicillium malachiteum]|nr:hypothetical protein N7488_009104 [Penicillium malachiteum]
MLLGVDDLPVIHEKLLSSELSDMFAAGWARCDKTGRNALFWTLIKCLRWDMAAIAFPRLCVVGFSIAQPFLIGKVISVLELTDDLSLYKSYGLVAATVIVFTGIAILQASYEHLGYRATTIIRGGLMSVVFQHMMDQPLGSTDESRSMSLMGADIEMLADRQMDWLHATEKRITFTNSIMGSIRNVKFLGLSEIMSSKIEGLRKEELEISKRFRRFQSIRVCMINAPLAIGELATLAAYGILALLDGSGGLAVDQAITSLSLISLMITPLRNLMLAIPNTFVSMGCLYRIQDFLKSQTYSGEIPSSRLKLAISLLSYF